MAGRERGPERGREAGGAPREEPAARIVSEMAHQLKNPMQAIAMNLEVLRVRITREAPALWEELESYATAVERGVRELDRRLALVTALGRRRPEAEAESVSLGSTVAELVEALRYDRTLPAVEVAREGEGVEVRARTGYLVELVYRLLAAARARAGEGGVTVAVGAGEEGEVALTVSLAGSGAGPVDEEEAGRWRALAERAGGRLEAAGEGSVVARAAFRVR